MVKGLTGRNNTDQEKEPQTGELSPVLKSPTLHNVCPFLGLTRQVASRYQVTELCEGAESEVAPRGYGALHTLVSHQTKSDAVTTPQG
jgi:hypothetical protein